MKKFAKAVVLFGFTLALASNTSFAQFTIDEFGGPLTSFPSLIGPDPSGGVGGPVLIYLLPFTVTSGDLLLIEPPPPGGIGTNSDIVRFWNSAANPNQSQIIFYSDASPLDPPDSPADSGLPTQFQPLLVTIPEVGPEGNNGALYLAAPGMPGAPTTGVAVQYNIISDVPEPSSLVSLIGGIGVLFGIKRFRR
jgi:hypothetical protein